MSDLPFFVADTHFGHKKIVEFLRSDGTKLRPWDNVDEMNEALIGNWNRRVGLKDKVYVLGDVVFGKKNEHLLSRLNGDKLLVKGNHDLYDMEVYAKYFRDIRAIWPVADFVLSHVPIHPQAVTRWGKNVHGHLHDNRVLDAEGNIDPRYFCVSVEHIDFAPIRLDELEARMK